MNIALLQSWAGLAGVADGERPSAVRWGGRLELPLLMVAFWIPVQWYLEVTGQLSDAHGRVADWLVWSVFVFETILLTSLVADKAAYLRNNWLNLVIIVAGLPLIWGLTPLAGVLRSLRLLLAVGLWMRFSSTVRAMLAHNRLGTTLAVAMVVIIVGGVLMAGLDPAVDDPWEGIWWAWVTVTTVGYGDIVPVSPAGKLFGSVLILLGVALFSLMTASFAAFFFERGMTRVEEDIGRDVDRVEQEESTIEAHLLQITRSLERIEARLDELERRAGDRGGKPLR